MVKYIPHERVAKKFDLEEKIKMATGEICIYDKIQESRDDCEIYPTLEKYGCLDKMMLNREDLYADFREFTDLRGIKDAEIKAKEMFYKLPIDVRKEFNNDYNDFSKNGEKYIKKLQEEDKKLEVIKNEIELNNEKIEMKGQINE